MNQLLGAHTSTSGGVSKAIERANKLNFSAIQIFTKNNNRWFSKPLEEDEIEKFRSLDDKSTVKFIVSHDSYLISVLLIRKYSKSHKVLSLMNLPGVNY